MGSPLTGGAHLYLRVKNDSLAPLLGAKVDRELRKKFIRNGAFVLVNEPGQADNLLTVTLKGYSDTTEAYRSGDTLLAAGFNLLATAFITLEESGGDIIYEDSVGANSSVLKPVRPTTAEVFELPDDAMALQALAETLASNITVSLLNQAW
jgi:hypothetical protein